MNNECLICTGVSQLCMARTDVLRNNVGKCPFNFTLALGQQKLIYKDLELEENL